MSVTLLLSSIDCRTKFSLKWSEPDTFCTSNFTNITSFFPWPGFITLKKTPVFFGLYWSLDLSIKTSWPFILMAGYYFFFNLWFFRLLLLTLYIFCSRPSEKKKNEFRCSVIFWVDQPANWQSSWMPIRHCSWLRLVSKFGNINNNKMYQGIHTAILYQVLLSPG